MPSHAKLVAQACFMSFKSFPAFPRPESSRKNLRLDELEAFRMLAAEMLKMDRAGLEAALANGTIIEVNCDG